MLLVFVIAYILFYYMEKKRQYWLQDAFLQQKKPWKTIVKLEGWLGGFFALYLEIKYLFYTKKLNG